MKCTKCGEQIPGDRYGPDAITLDNSPSHLQRQPQNVRHPHCVDDPVHLDEHNFHKWTVATINAELQRRLAFEQRVQQELELIHRGLHALPTHLNQNYIDEIYNAPSTPDYPAGPVAPEHQPPA